MNHLGAIDKSSKTPFVPKLLPPGHPLPWPERIVLRLIGKFVAPRSRTRRDESRTTGVKMHEKIIRLAETIPASLRERKILVPPQRGLEDSSRYWSVNELLEHVTIVDEGISALILDLSERPSDGKPAEFKISTAAVKPENHAADTSNPEAELIRFRAITNRLFTDLDGELAKPDRDFSSERTARHPWFGKLRAAEWYWVLGMHASVHFKQLKEIVRGLRLESTSPEGGVDR